MPGRFDPLPEAFHELLAAQVAAEAEVAVVVVVLGAEVPGLDRAAAGDPDRRVRLLDRLRPGVHVAQLEVLAVPGEGVLLRPGAQDQVVRLLVLVAQRGRVGSVGVVVVHRRAHGEAGDQAPAGDHVQHRHLFGHARRRVVEGDRLAQEQDSDIARAARKGRGHQRRRRHHAVGVLMVLVHADAIEPHLGRFLEEVEVVVVDFVTLSRGRTAANRRLPRRCDSSGGSRRAEMARA